MLISALHLAYIALLSGTYTSTHVPLSSGQPCIGLHILTSDVQDSCFSLTYAVPGICEKPKILYADEKYETRLLF